MNTSEFLALSPDELLRFGEKCAMEDPQRVLAFLEGVVGGLVLERFPDQRSLQQQAYCAPMVVYETLTNAVHGLQNEFARRPVRVVRGGERDNAIAQQGDPSPHSTEQVVG